MVARAGKKEEGRSAASQVGGLEKRGEEIGGGGSGRGGATRCGDDVGPGSEKKTGWPSPDEQYGFGFI
jgi:hypothetical protein